MAIQAVPGERISMTSSNDDTVTLGDAAAHAVSTWVVMLAGDSLTGTVDVQGRPRESAADFVNISYRDRTSDDTIATTQLTQANISTGQILEINAAGLDVQLVVSVSSGTLHIDIAPPLIG